MKILVTGATGFIGSHLFRTLVRMGHECIGMDNQFIETDMGWAYQFAEENKNTQFFLGDEGDCSNGWNVFKICKNFSPDAIFNLAVMCLPHSLIEPIENYSKNIEITTNIVQEATKRNIRLVHFSSSEVYGSAEEEIMSEDHKLRPSTPYAAAKAAPATTSKSSG
jgi:UDP-glucose 4-epimerase